MTAPTKTAPKLRHEEFCLPRPGADAPRIESYPFYSDGQAGGRPAVTHIITRCIECGAQNNNEIGA